MESIQKNSSFPHQIILHINDGNDGSLDWAKKNQIDFTYSETNIGICKAVNLSSKLSKHDYIVFMNDDMYVLPGWDSLLMDEIQKLNTDSFMISATMIEPYDTKNKCVIVADYGKTSEDFKEDKLLREFTLLNKEDWSGSTWPPSIVHKKWWEKVGGYSEEFSPGMSSDDDFAMKMWGEGCRIYKGAGKSRVYHFISKSTERVSRNDGRKQFLKKWGIKQSTFHRYFTRRGEKYLGKLSKPQMDLVFLLKKTSDRLLSFLP